jgi:hypothetical protein
MSRHIPRRERWDRRGPNEYRSVDGLIVRYEQRAWWAEIRYQLSLAGPAPDAPPVLESRHERLGPFRRPRNAMVEAERQVTVLRNRYQDQIRFG